MSAHILCIEDEAGLREDITLELEDAGYTVTFATDGAAGMASLRDERFDLVLCDVQMPIMSGLDVLAAANMAGSPTPFLMLTAYSDPVLKARCAALGARGLLVKPIDYGELLAQVAKELAR